MIRLSASASCARCPWTAGPGDMASVFRAAEKHTAPGHPTSTVAVPAPAGKISTEGKRT